METARLLDVAASENQRLQAKLEGAVKFNEDRHAMFVQARTEVANMQAELQNGARSRVQLEVRIGTLEKESFCLVLYLCALD
jgi:hypothetical protein